ncbi:MAG TPA: ATP-binding protein [Campylobacterales bacterium]|nr:ATP-binding protein [Campylobacterales bacterium]
MDILEILYAREFKKVTYNVRKLSFETKKILLLGPRGAGKSTMIYDYLSGMAKGSFLYIDFNDFRMRDYDIGLELSNFIKKHHIRLLVLEHFDFSFEVPSFEEVIITTCEQKSLDGFTTQTLYPLDFEEFISFDKRELNLEAIFSSYAISGTFPAIFGQQKGDFIKVYQDFLHCFAEDELQMSILQLLASRQGTIVSIYALFLELKERMKISKDTFYAYTKKLQDENVLFLVEKFGHKKSPKKLYLIDFTLRSALSFEKDFIKRFENIVFLELLKRDKIFYYTDAFDFYLPKEEQVILSIPFLPSNLIEGKLERLNKHLIDLEVKTVQVVTMEVEKVYEQNGITFELIPFWSFATSL